MTIGSTTGEPLPGRLARMRITATTASYQRLCREIAEGLDLAWVSLRLAPAPDTTGSIAAGSEFHWPTGTTRPWRRARTVPIRFGERLLAELMLPAAVLRRPSVVTAQTLDDVVDVLGSVLNLACLAANRAGAQRQARVHAERIAAARRQAFLDRDAERRELERDLHDGAQHHLVALRMSVGLLDIHLDRGDLASAGTVLTGLGAGLILAEETLLGTAAGSSPPVLVDHGLVAALATELDDTPGSIELDSELHWGQRYSLEVETAVYLTCLEAVNNARKHALGAGLRVRLREEPGGLLFSVSDQGPGLDPQASGSFGLGNMRRRIVAVGGRLDVVTRSGFGTTISGLIPQHCLG